MDAVQHELLLAGWSDCLGAGGESCPLVAKTLTLPPEA